MSDRTELKYEEHPDTPDFHIESGNGRAGVMSEGGLVTDFSVDGVDVLMPSKRTYIYRGGKLSQRGGIPLLFPNNGPMPESDSFTLGQHGFARNEQWQAPLFQNRPVVHIELRENEETLEQYPYRFRLNQTISVDEETQTLRQLANVQNPSSTEALPACFGLHPYFAVDTGMKPHIETNIPGFDPEKSNWPNTEFYPAQEHVELVIPGTGIVTMDLVGKFDRLAIWSEPGEPYICIEPWRGGVGSLTQPGERLDIPPDGNEYFGSAISLQPE